MRAIKNSWVYGCLSPLSSDILAQRSGLCLCQHEMVNLHWRVFDHRKSLWRCLRKTGSFSVPEWRTRRRPKKLGTRRLRQCTPKSLAMTLGIRICAKNSRLATQPKLLACLCEVPAELHSRVKRKFAYFFTSGICHTKQRPADVRKPTKNQCTNSWMIVLTPSCQLKIAAVRVPFVF